MNIERKMYYENGVTLEKGKLVSIYVGGESITGWFEGRIQSFDNLYISLDVSQEYYSEILKIKHDQVIDIKEV